MPTTRKPAVRSAAAPVKPVVPVKPSAKMAATPAGKSAAAKAAKAKAAKANGKAGKPVQAAAAKAGKPAKPVKAPKVPKADKPKKPKVIRDSFTMPKSEYVVLDALKARAAREGKTVKKSELLRAGLKVLVALPDPAFANALDAVPALKAHGSSGA